CDPNWGVSGDDIDAYIIHIPGSALPGGTRPPPTSAPVTGGTLPPLEVQGNNARASGQMAGSQPPATVPGGGGDAAAVSTGGNRGRIAITPPAMLFFQRSLSFLRNLQARGAITRDSATYLAPLPLPLLAMPGVGWPMHLNRLALSA